MTKWKDELKKWTSGIRVEIETGSQTCVDLQLNEIFKLRRKLNRWERMESLQKTRKLADLKKELEVRTATTRRKKKKWAVKEKALKISTRENRNLKKALTDPLKAGFYWRNPM